MVGFKVDAGVYNVWRYRARSSPDRLREAMGFMATDERHQGLAFLLEHATLAGLKADIGGSEIVTQWRRLSCNPASVAQLVDARAGIFLSWSVAERKEGLGQILDSLDPMFEFWFERSLESWKAGISPASFAMAARWGPTILILAGERLNWIGSKLSDRRQAKHDGLRRATHPRSLSGIFCR